jgi:hypothetical protein
MDLEYKDTYPFYFYGLYKKHENNWDLYINNIKFYINSTTKQLRLVAQISGDVEDVKKSLLWQVKTNMIALPSLINHG